MPTPDASQGQLPDDELVYSSDPTQLEAEAQSSSRGVMSSLAAQAAAARKGVDIAQQGVEDVQKAEQGAMAGEREKSGRAFAAEMAQGGGGSLAGMRQNQLSRGIAEGQLAGNYTMQQLAAQRLANQAQREAAQAQGEFYTEKQKLQQQMVDRQTAQVNDLAKVQDAIRNEFKTRTGNVNWWGNKDQVDFANWILSTYGQSPNKKIRDYATQAAADAQANEGQFSD
jgi:hypothetical protein